MHPSEALSTAAVVTVTVAGFTGVVAVFGGGPLHEWPRIDRFRLHLLLSFSLVPLALSLVGLLLLSTELSERTVWRWSSAVAAVLLLGAGLWSFVRFVGFPAEERQRANASALVFYGGSILGVSSCALQILNLGVLGQFWPFLTAIVVSVLGATVQFARLVLNRPPPR